MRSHSMTDDRHKRKAEGGPASKQPAVKKAQAEAPAAAAKSSAVSNTSHAHYWALLVESALFSGCSIVHLDFERKFREKKVSNASVTDM
jgi:hypothetical protein